MTNKTLFFLFFFVLNLAQVASQNKEFNLDFKEYVVPSSVRAVEIINDSITFFAGSNGIYGKIENGHLHFDSIPREKQKELHFRSIAFNGKDVFMMTLENPAMLFRVNPFEKKLTPELVYKEEHEKVFYDAMIFENEKLGYAVGDPTTNCFSFLKTTDGGKTWKKIECNTLPPVNEGEAAFAASNSNISALGNNVWFVSGGKSARVYKSLDQGDSWEIFQTPIQQGGTMTGIYTIDFFDQLIGIIMGGNWDDKTDFNSTKAITKDGGKTWELIANQEIPGYISCVKFVPGSQGKMIFAVSTEGIYHSSEQGKSWVKDSEKGFYSIRFLNENTAWLSGNRTIAKMTIYE